MNQVVTVMVATACTAVEYGSFNCGTHLYTI